MPPIRRWRKLHAYYVQRMYARYLLATQRLYHRHSRAISRLPGLVINLEVRVVNVYMHHRRMPGTGTEAKVCSVRNVVRARAAINWIARFLPPVLHIQTILKARLGCRAEDVDHCRRRGNECSGGVYYVPAEIGIGGGAVYRTAAIQVIASVCCNGHWIAAVHARQKWLRRGGGRHGGCG